MRQILNKRFHLFFNIFIFLGLGYYLFENQSVFANLRNINLSIIFYILIFEILLTSINAVINLLIIRSIDKKVGILDTILLQFSNNFLNKLAPKLGAGYRAVFLKKKYNFPYTKFLATIAGLYVISFLTYALIGLVSALLIFFKYQLINWFIIAGFISLAIIMIVIILIKPKEVTLKNKFIEKIKNIIQGWQLIKKNKQFIVLLVFLTITIALFSTLELSLIYQGIGHKTDILRLIYLSSVSLFSAIANITPDGIGVNEALFGYSNNILAIDANILILGSILLRAIRLLISIFLGGASYLILNTRDHFQE